MAAVNHERMTQLFLELVQIDSLSRRERDVAIRLQHETENAGAVCRYDNSGERTGSNIGNLIARIGGNVAGVAPLMLSAHMDTVAPGEGIKPIVEGGAIRTDGTTILGGDDKSGCAIICEVLHRLHEENSPHGPIEAIFTVCEESGLQGARNLDLAMIEAREGLVYDSDAPGHLIVRGPHAARMRFTVKGLEAHAGAAPERGISAIQIAAEAIAVMRLGRIDAETTANLGRIEGGRALNVIPGEVVVTGEARSVDRNKLEAQVDHMLACFKHAVSRASVTLDGRRYEASIDYSIHHSYEGMSIPEDAPLVKSVIEAAARTGRVLRPEGTGGACDANIFNRRGLLTVNLATGMRDIHTVREWLDIQEMIATAEVTLELIALRAEHRLE
jgi:tripeptide aminopeptidase